MSLTRDVRKEMQKTFLFERKEIDLPKEKLETNAYAGMAGSHLLTQFGSLRKANI